MISFNANNAVRTLDAVGHGLGGNVKTAVGSYLLSAPLEEGQVIPMVAVPSGARILDVTLSADDLDNAEELVLHVGDGQMGDRYIKDTTVAQGGGVARLSSQIGHGYRYKEGDTVDITVATASTAGRAAGLLRVCVMFVID
jgi:hypothetical protein